MYSETFTGYEDAKSFAFTKICTSIRISNQVLCYLYMLKRAQFIGLLLMKLVLILLLLDESTEPVQ